MLSDAELAAIRDKAETRVRLGSLGIGSSTEPVQIIWRDDQSAATVDDLRGLLGHIDALAAALAAERSLADDLAAAIWPLVGMDKPKWQVEDEYRLYPDEYPRLKEALARHAAARQPQEATDATG